MKALKSAVFVRALLLFLSIFCVTGFPSAFAWDHGPLKCKGLYGIMGHLERVEMSKTKEDASSIILLGTHDKYNFKVDWNFELDTLYTFISVNGVDKFFSTMRVPTENHNDSFGEFRDETGFRLGITCAFEK